VEVQDGFCAPIAGAAAIKDKFLVLKTEKLVKECKGLTTVLDIICIYVVAKVRYRKITF
jgi:hypothetical protein